MPMVACTTEEKNTYFVPSTVIPGWENNQDGTLCVHYFRKAYNASEKVKFLKFPRKKPENRYNPDLSFNALNGEIMPDLYSDE